MPKLSAVITCFNNEDTIIKCVESLSCADEIVVLDSFSNDTTLDKLDALNCIVYKQKFKGFAQQKQDAINLASHNWILLLDSDEFLDGKAQHIIRQWKKSTTQLDAYTMPRLEWVFWQWSHPWVRKNRFIRLFNRNTAHVLNSLVHESIQSSGKIAPLDATINHYGETSITKKMEKINQYSLLAAQQKFQQGQTVSVLRLIFYPPWYFFRQYFLRRQIFNGVAGFINASLNTHYAFLKYSKLYELQKNKN
jgi:glycosyltransferase involved in cell wall biosynthesis